MSLVEPSLKACVRALAHRQERENDGLALRIELRGIMLVEIDVVLLNI